MTKIEIKTRDDAMAKPLSFTRATMTLLAASLTFLSAALAETASFDCKPYLAKRKVPEAIICATSELAKMDSQLNDYYKYILENMARKFRTREETERAKKGLRTSQAEWLVERNACEFDVKCLFFAYGHRLKLLREFQDELSQLE
jgi:uncharacterized protein